MFRIECFSMFLTLVFGIFGVSAFEDVSGLCV